MSAQDSPQACGPEQPRPQGQATGRNPLKRSSDRVEAWCSGLIAVVLAIGLPMASLSVGLASYRSAMRIVETQSAERHQVTARVTSTSPTAAGSATDRKQNARLSWTDQDATQRTVVAPIPQDKTVGSTVRIWVDREGAVQDPPLSAYNATATGWLMGGVTAVGVFALAGAARKSTRRALDRRRYARWDAEWERVEPLWSTRFHS
ncbi:hypothetical protein [Streptomyces sp. 142MFCol3.1]|uniref:Rv1733c family protein n=1 Tax=Streptomyces sp. 142MFCol3.1 TaxID=1172179 RepID=UPI00048CFC81|nr:hypothetical protein [Streptomyces sp. 142MFCol3.1]